MSDANRRQGKGVYGGVGLPVAGRYPHPPGRNRLLLAGAAVFAVLLAGAAIAYVAGDDHLLSNGPLSSDHASLETDCAACHAGARTVTDAACADCHEPHGGALTFAVHYAYRSTDPERRALPVEKELACSGCHVEHRGREAAVTRSPDARCLPCHDFGSFGRRHPEFAFAAEGAADSGALTFPHVHHVNELMRRRGFAPAEVERTCLVCHDPRPDGRGFEPIAFDRHCAECHLTGADRTPPLPVADGDAGTPGIETLEAIRRRGGAETQWAWTVSAGAFHRLGEQLVKSPLDHRDPWVLYNLRLLRHRLVPDAGLADLLTATPEAPPEEPRALHAEAIATLERQIQGLRARPEPEIQEELRRMEALLERLRRRLDDPDETLDDSRFRLASDPPAGLDSETAGAVEAVAAALTETCRRCHQVRDATIVRVQTDQRTLRRAEFDHAAHVVQRRCLDCHDAIPVRDYLGAAEPPGPEVDRAEIYDLPRIAVCRECHNPRLASDRCVDCHRFHPDPSHRTALLAVVEPPPAAASGGVPNGKEEAADAR